MDTRTPDRLTFVIVSLGDYACLRDTLRHGQRHYPQAIHRVVFDQDQFDPRARIDPEQGIEFHPFSTGTPLQDALADCMLETEADFLILLREDTLLSPHIELDLQAASAQQPDWALTTPLADGFSPYLQPLVPGTDVAGTRFGLNLTEKHVPSVAPKGLGCTLCFNLTLYSGETWAHHLRDTHQTLATVLAAEGKRLHVLSRTIAHQCHGGSKSLEPPWRALFDHLGYPTKHPLADRAQRALPELRDAIPGPPLKPDWQGILRESARFLKKRLLDTKGVHRNRPLIPGLQRITEQPRAAMPLWANLHFRRSPAFKVIYLVEDLVVAGGVFSIVQLTNELWFQGVEARIAYLRKAHELQDWRFGAAPMQFRNRADILASLPPCDVVVATFWTSASLAAELVQMGRAKAAAYFVQDFEPWFYLEGDRRREQALASYGLIPHRIVKSAWLQTLLKQHGHASHKIHLGLDRNIFFPTSSSGKDGTPAKKDRPRRIIAMARPATPRRGFDTLVQVLSAPELAGEHWQVALFGDDYLARKNLPFPYEDLGVIRDHHRLAEAYREADIFLETSDFQGFGRTSLEAMACGCACILTNVGGLHEYAQDGENCVLVAPRSPQAVVDALLFLKDNPEQTHRLASQATATTREFDHLREARATARYLKEIVETSGI